MGRIIHLTAVMCHGQCINLVVLVCYFFGAKIQYDLHYPLKL